MILCSVLNQKQTLDVQLVQVLVMRALVWSQICNSIEIVRQLLKMRPCQTSSKSPPILEKHLLTLQTKQIYQTSKMRRKTRLKNLNHLLKLIKTSRWLKHWGNEWRPVAKLQVRVDVLKHNLSYRSLHLEKSSVVVDQLDSAQKPIRDIWIWSRVKLT